MAITKKTSGPEGGPERMRNATGEDDRKLVAFWSEALSLSEADREEALREGMPDAAELAPCEKLAAAAVSLGRCGRVLDYGCGNGWAAILAARNGCSGVTAADAAPGALETARFFAERYGMADRIRFCRATEGWLERRPAASYDALFCSNVLDVIPPETAGRILSGLARVLPAGGRAVVGLNYYLSPEDAEARGLSLTEDRKLYVDGVLRLVSRTDGEWEELFSPWFRTDRLEHFAWPGEETERRRLFFLTRKEQ